MNAFIHATYRYQPLATLYNKSLAEAAQMAGKFGSWRGAGK